MSLADEMLPRGGGPGGAASKALYWRAYKREHGEAAGIRIADELRRQVLAQRPGWPTERDRADDRAAHERVLDALEAAATRRG